MAERVALTPRFRAQPREWVERPDRLYERFHVRVRGTDAAGKKFKVTTVLENISEGGLYVLLDRRVEGGAPLSFFVSFSTLPQGEAKNAPRLCARGHVLRAEAQPDGLCGVAVSFTRHRFVQGHNVNGGAWRAANHKGTGTG
ncbi:MAG TPA: PilZ domain-containing protein [Pyrinomonadaceae bacterium]